jgi:enoyl-CoA hydratase/carnithine racemase
MSKVDLQVGEGVAVLRLDNPPLNLFTRALTEALDRTITRLEADNTLRAVVVTGAGDRAFSAGSDVREFPALMASGRVVEDKLALENAVFDRLARLRQPTIAAVNGLALGGGAEFALCADYRIIAEDGRIGFPEVRLGTVPGSGGLSRLPRLIGAGRALALCLDGAPTGAAEALRLGLVDEIAPSGQCLELALRRAREWASRPATAVQSIKQGVSQAGRDAVTTEMRAWLEVSRAIFATADMREGVSAFLEKRPPRFRYG